MAIGPLPLNRPSGFWVEGTTPMVVRPLAKRMAGSVAEWGKADIGADFEFLAEPKQTVAATTDPAEKGG